MCWPFGKGVSDGSVSPLGIAAGTLTTISFLPQVLKTWRSQSAKDFSFWMLGAFASGVLLWVIYGLDRFASDHRDKRRDLSVGFGIGRDENEVRLMQLVAAYLGPTLLAGLVSFVSSLSSCTTVNSLVTDCSGRLFMRPGHGDRHTGKGESDHGV